MNLTTIEHIYTALDILSKKSSVSLKVKLILYKNKLKPYKDLMEELRKECITESVSSFEQKRQQILDAFKGDEMFSKMKKLYDDNEVDAKEYSEAIKNLETIYMYECEDAPTLTLTLEEIPDDIGDIDQKLQEIIFSLVEE